MRRRFRYDSVRNKVVEVKIDQEPAPAKGPFCWSDTQGYHSPVTGRWIEGRAERREDLKRHNCIDARDLKPS